MYRYEIDEKLTVRIFVDSQEAPVILQPTWPNGEAFALETDAENWATSYIEHVEGSSDSYPLSGPGIEPQKISKKDKLVQALMSVNMTEEEALSYLSK
jgi:hypothetical protein